MSDLVIGIDLGTSNSLVAFCDQRGPQIIPAPDGRRILPSIVSLDAVQGKLTVGEPATSQAAQPAELTVYSVKRLMGRGVDDLREELPYLPYRLLPHGAQPGEPEDPAAAGRPRDEKHAQTSEAPEGRQIVAHGVSRGESWPTSIPSPVGATQAPNQTPAPAPESLGTPDPANVSPMVDVELAGQRFTPQQLSAVILSELKSWAEAHFRAPVTRAVITVPAYFDDAQRQATRDAGQIAGLEVLRILSEPTAAAMAYGLDRLEDATIAVYDLGGGTFDLSILRIEKGVFRVLATHGDTHLGGDDFDRMIVQHFEREIRQQFGESLDFDPPTRQALRGFAQQVRLKLSESAQATVEIDMGEDRIYRARLTGEQYEAMVQPLVDRTLQCSAAAMRDAKLDAAGVERVVLAGGMTYTPSIRRQVAEHFNCEIYTALNPMEVVALGAAVQASILAGARRDTLLLDVVPLSLGIETMGGAVAHMIARGSTIPCHASSLFSTSVDGQTSVSIQVVQGERQLVKDCRSLGRFVLGGLPPMPAGIPKIMVNFLVDASGILSVWAKEQRSGIKASIQVAPSYGLSRAEVTRMVKQGVRNLPADLMEHWLIDLRNQIRMDTAAIEKALASVGDAFDAGARQELLDIIDGIRGMETWTDAQAIQRALQYMNRKSQPLAELAIARSLREAAGQREVSANQ